MKSEHAANLYLAEQAGRASSRASSRTSSRTTYQPQAVRPGFLVALASSLFLFLSI